MSANERCEYCNSLSAEAILEPKTETITADYLVKGRTITLRNVQVYECPWCGNVYPEIWKLGPLLHSIIASPDLEQTWEYVDGTWKRLVEIMVETS